MLSDPLKLKDDDEKNKKITSSVGTSAKDDNEFTSLFSKFGKPKTFMFGDFSQKIK